MFAFDRPGGPLTRELMQSLASDSIPAGAPAAYDPHAADNDTDHPLIEKLGSSFTPVYIVATSVAGASR